MEKTLPCIKTALPGPKSLELLALRQQYVARGVSNAHNDFVASAEDALITDVDGNVFLDVAAGIGMQNAAYRDPGVVKVVKEQLDKHIHPCFHASYWMKYSREWDIRKRCSAAKRKT